jgi:hypothetical protein
MQLTKNFSLHEFTKSNTAARLGIDNNPIALHIHNLVDLCEHVLQPLRDAIGQSIRITSGYRSAELNAAIGGASKNGKPTSDHCFGRAADIELVIDGKEDNARLYNAIKSLDLDFYQLIWEFGDDDQPNWIHVAYRKDNVKKQCLKAYKDNGKTKYVTI